jgi:hypothetical protein
MPAGQKLSSSFSGAQACFGAGICNEWYLHDCFVLSLTVLFLEKPCFRLRGDFSGNGGHHVLEWNCNHLQHDDQQ